MLEVVSRTCVKFTHMLTVPRIWLHIRICTYVKFAHMINVFKYMRKAGNISF